MSQEAISVLAKSAGYGVTNIFHNGLNVMNMDVGTHIASALLYEYFTGDLVKQLFNPTEGIPFIGDYLGDALKFDLTPAVESAQTYVMRMFIDGTDQRYWVILLDNLVVGILIYPVLASMLLGNEIGDAITLTNPIFKGAGSLVQNEIKHDKETARKTGNFYGKLFG